MFGTVPSFMRHFPDAAVAGAWKQMKLVEMNPNGAVPPKFKSLISLAVAAQIPCAYCVYADAELAKIDGTTQAELDAAVAVSALVRHWSTYLNGLALDEDAFRKEVDGIVDFLKKKTESTKK
ncbi:MAG: carboxymuconolactone decarboxylase family protein [Candidatus Schekmanbacteria bacterium]|nr:carboxymuconolactone decarboxylase family protein [Candidatus Schekmanbacteria bacterium]